MPAHLSRYQSLTWRKSTASGGTGGECIEVAAAASSVLIRDSRDRSGPVLAVSAPGWAEFLDRIRSGGQRRQ